MTKLASWLDRQTLLRALDAIPASLALFDLTATPIKANHTANRLLHGPDGDRIRSVVEEFASFLCQRVKEVGLAAGERSTELAVREVRANEQRYRLRGCYVGFATPTDAGAILVSLEHLSPDALPDDALRARFHLTRREVRIARMLAERRTNLEIAEELFISPNTARTHTQRVLQKLGVRSRAEVAMKILYEYAGKIRCFE